MNKIKTTFKTLLIVVCCFLYSCGDENGEDCVDYIPACLGERIQLITTYFVENGAQGTVSISEYELNDEIYYRIPVFGWNSQMDVILDTDCESVGLLANGKDVDIDGFMFLEDAVFKCNVWEY